MTDIFDADARRTDPLVAAEAEWTSVDSLLDPYDEHGRTGVNIPLLVLVCVMLVIGTAALVVMIQAYMNLVAWEPMIAERCGPA